MRLEAQIKAVALEGGAGAVGIASRERLADAPLSAGAEYLLPSTRSVICYAIPLDRKVTRDYLAKRDWLAHGADQKRVYQQLYIIGDRLVEFLQGKGFDARRPDVNNVYRPEPGCAGATDMVNMVQMVPEFSHRYAAVAAGLGRLGWAGGLMTPQFGMAVFLGSVLTSATLEPDPILENDPCDKCKLCTSVCPVEMIHRKTTVSVTIGGREYAHGQKRSNACCLIGCLGYHGLGPGKAWSTWSPYRVAYPLPKEDGELVALSRRLRAADPFFRGKRASLTMRDKCFDPNETFVNTCGNCGLICWEKREDREENQRLLVNSGVVALTADGRRMAVPAQEVTEVETPYGVGVAMLRREAYPLPALGGLTAEAAQCVRSARDAQALSYLASLPVAASAGAAV